MRPWLLAPALALLVLPAAAAAQVQAPDEPPPPAPSPGGAEYGKAPPPAPRPARRPLRVSDFDLAPSKLLAGASTSVTLRLAGGRRGGKARVRVVLVPREGGPAAATLRLGWRRVGVTIVRDWRLRGLAAGAYIARVHAVDREGGTLKRTASASGKLPVTVDVAPPAPAPPAATPVAPTAAGPFFPITGSQWSFGGPDARFGAERNGHIHQGQDITAPEGTPIVSVVAGSVFWRAVQPAGAGHYLVVRGGDGRDYVFMHLVAGSELVAKGDPVAAGQQIGQVGTTGDASGPHLHFELWPGGWYAKGSNPIDPLPELQAWALPA